MWPRSWNSRSLRRTTVWPRWMSGAVGSIPSFTRSGRPSPSWRSSAPSGRQSTAFRARKRAASPGESVIGAMLDCPPSHAGCGGRPPSRPVHTLRSLMRRRTRRRRTEARPLGPPQHGRFTDHSPEPTRSLRPVRRQRRPPQRPGPRSSGCGSALILTGLSAARAGLDGVRDDDGRRQRPARSWRTRPSSSGAKNSMVTRGPDPQGPEGRRSSWPSSRATRTASSCPPRTSRRTSGTR